MGDANRKTTRSVDGRLFPAEEIGPFRMSVQAGVGYGSSPREDLPHLEDYRLVEVYVFADRPEPVDVRTVGLPEDVVRLFSPVEHPAMAGYVSADQVGVIRQTLLQAAMQSPNAGYPPGSVGWAGRKVFHGTSAEAAMDIRDGGVDLGKCERGYFGQAFYLAEDRELAESNYADFSGEEGGAIVVTTVSEGARILDMRNAADAALWQVLAPKVDISRSGCHVRAVELGVDGIYDRSFGGLAIYNPDAVAVVSVDLGAAPSPGPRR